MSRIYGNEIPKYTGEGEIHPGIKGLVLSSFLWSYFHINITVYGKNFGEETLPISLFQHASLIHDGYNGQLDPYSRALARVSGAVEFINDKNTFVNTMIEYTEDVALALVKDGHFIPGRVEFSDGSSNGYRVNEGSMIPWIDKLRPLES